MKKIYPLHRILFKSAILFQVLIWMSVSVASSQSWMQLMNKPSPNYYEVETSYRVWQDSVDEQLSTARVNSQVAYPEQVKTLQKTYKHWAKDFMNRMDPSGNLLSDEQRQALHKEYAKFNGPTPGVQTTPLWTPIGPTHVFPLQQNYGSGLVYRVAVHPLDTAIIFASAGGGGVWRTLDGGSFWEPLTDTVASYGNNCLTFEPGTGNLLYLSVGSTLYKSSDLGITWATINAPPAYVTAAHSLHIDPVNTQNLFLPGYSGVFKSADGGNSWNVVTTELIRDFEFNPLNPETIYMLGTGKVYRSYDGGLTIDSTSISTPWTAQDMAVTPADSGYIYVYAGENGGSSGHDGMVALSTDGGTTFNNQPVSPGLYTFNYWLKRIFVSPTNRDEIYFAGIMLNKSVDAGVTWNNVINFPGLPFMHVDQRCITTVGNTFWFGNDGGVYKTDDGGVSFLDITGNMQISDLLSIACSPTDSMTILGGATHMGCILNTDTGWANIEVGDGVNVAVHPFNSQDLFIKSQYAYQHSVDGGITLTNLTGITETQYGFYPDYPMVYNYQNPSSVYTVKSNVFKSIDGGTNFAPISNFATNTYRRGVLHVNPTDTSYIYTNGYRSTDGGITWTILSKDHQRIAVDTDEPWRIWGVKTELTNTIISFSQDTGDTWQPVYSADIPYDAVRDFEYVDNGYDGLILVLQHEIFYIDNRLSNWQPYMNGLPTANYWDATVVENINKVRLATSGRGFWECPLYDPVQPPVADFIVDNDTICPDKTAQFYDNSLYNGPGFNPVYSWTFPGGNPAFSNLVHPSVTYPVAGIYNVSLTLVNSNGTDSVTKTSFIVVEPPAISTTPLVHDFEGIFLLPGWLSDNPLQAGYSWYLDEYTGGYNLSEYSAGYWYPNPIYGTPVYDAFMTNRIDLSGLQNPILHFDRAYGMHNTNADTLRIFYTSDCDFNRTYIYSNGGSTLATAPQQNYFFEPDSSQWATDTIALNGLPTLVQFGFEVVNYGGNNVYVDNINITNGLSTSISESPVKKTNLNLYPNPASGSVTLEWETEKESSAYFSLFNSLGQEIIHGKSIYQGTNQIDVSQLAQGLYTIRVVMKTEVVFKSLVIE